MGLMAQKDKLKQIANHWLNRSSSIHKMNTALICDQRNNLWIPSFPLQINRTTQRSIDWQKTPRWTFVWSSWILGIINVCTETLGPWGHPSRHCTADREGYAVIRPSLSSEAWLEMSFDLRLVQGILSRCSSWSSWYCLHSYVGKSWTKIEKLKMYYINPNRKFILLPQEQRQGLSLKSHPKDYNQKLTYWYGHTNPSSVRGRHCLNRLYQAVDYISMPIATDF